MQFHISLGVGAQLRGRRVLDGDTGAEGTQRTDFTAGATAQRRPSGSPPTRARTRRLVPIRDAHALFTSTGSLRCACALCVLRRVVALAPAWGQGAFRLTMLCVLACAHACGKGALVIGLLGGGGPSRPQAQNKGEEPCKVESLALGQGERKTSETLLESILQPEPIWLSG